MDPHRSGNDGRDPDLPTGDEADEWLNATRDVRPLADRDEVAGPAGEEAPSVGLAERLRSRQESAAPGEAQLFSLDRRTAERLKRGQIPIESELDLHGFTQEEAFAALDDFLAQAWAIGLRCVLVITGKGTAREGGGVLRSMIPTWLAEGAHRERILAVSPAQPRHGGDGALYVMLRRARDPI